METIYLIQSQRSIGCTRCFDLMHMCTSTLPHVCMYMCEHENYLLSERDNIMHEFITYSVCMYARTRIACVYVYMYNNTQYIRTTYSYTYICTCVIITSCIHVHMMYIHDVHTHTHVYVCICNVYTHAYMHVQHTHTLLCYMCVMYVCLYVRIITLLL